MLTIRPNAHKVLRTFDRNKIRRLVEIFTGHCNLRYSQHIRSETDDPTCRLCLEDEETPHHLLIECPALARQRLYLTDKILDVPEEERRLVNTLTEVDRFFREPMIQLLEESE